MLMLKYLFQSRSLKLKSIEEFINTTGTAFPKGEIMLKSKITASYFLEKNPETGKILAAW